MSSQNLRKVAKASIWMYNPSHSDQVFYSPREVLVGKSVAENIRPTLKNDDSSMQSTNPNYHSSILQILWVISSTESTLRDHHYLSSHKACKATTAIKE